MLRRKLIVSALAVLTLALAVAPTADAGCFARHRARRAARQAARCAAPAFVAVPRAVPTPQACQGGVCPVASTAPAASSPIAWLNGVRASRGLRPLAWDASAAADAGANSARGFGHSTGGYRLGQVVGSGDFASVAASWLASPAHVAILLHPAATSAGAAGSGNVWTISVN